MKKILCRKLFSTFFLGIFFIKMLISAAPFIFSHFDNEVVAAVIMQLEIEDNGGKSSEKGKETVLKEYFTAVLNFTFLSPMSCMPDIPGSIDDEDHPQTFYPAVPTPPPNC